MDAVKTTFEFDSNDIRIPVKVSILGPLTIGRFTFSLDTGSTRSSIRPNCLERLGYDLTKEVGGINVRGVTGIGYAKTYTVSSLTALGQTKANVLLIAQDYPKSVTVDGLLGLDFFRGNVLALDFHQGTISLRPPRPRWQFWR